MTAATGFTVRISKMIESHRHTYWVILEHNGRPKDAKPWDKTGYITPYMSEHLDRAQYTAQEWADFFQVPVDDPYIDGDPDNPYVEKSNVNNIIRSNKRRN